MAAAEAVRLTYGHRKYAAIHLMFSRLIRLASLPDSDYVYVTLGGTEFRDVQSLRFIDPRLTARIYSFEHDKARYQLAATTAAKLQSQGLALNLINGSFFDYERVDELPHIFFLDLEGICGWGGYDEKLGQMFQDEVIREGDLLLITSALGRDPGIKEIMKTFSGEYSVLNITDEGEARRTYRRSHPSFTLYKGLNGKGLTRELCIRCLGGIKYQDPKHFPMGLYGYSILEGTTEFRHLVNDSAIQYYDMNDLRCCGATDRF
jgi:hypothetical protein